MPGAFHKVNNDNVIGGAARVLRAPKSYALPDQFAQIVDLSTYAPNATYGWSDVGTTKSASTIAIQAATSEWRGEQQGPIRTLYTEYTGTAHYEMEEMTPANKAAAGAVAATDPIAGTHRTNFTARNIAPDQMHLCFLRVDPLGRLHATIAPLAQWDGSALQRQFTRGQSESLAFPQKLYPDPNHTDPVSGDPIVFYDLDTD